MRLSHIAIATLSLGVVSHHSANAETLPAATPCELKLEKAASLLIFDLNLVLQQHNSLSAAEFARIKGSLQMLHDNENSSQATTCFKSFPMQRLRYQDWIRLHAHQVIRKANDRLDHVCARNTRIFVTTQKLHLDRAVSQNKLARAATLATTFEHSLRTDPMMSHCHPTQLMTKKVLDDYLPKIQNLAALPKVQAKMSSAYRSVKTKLDVAHSALQSSAGDLKPVPPFYEGSAKSQFSSQLEQCQLYAKILVDLGESGTDPMAIGSESISINDASEYCRSAQEKLPELTRQYTAHNRVAEIAALKRWRRFAFKGWDMERTFNAKGRPAVETMAGSAYLWTYHSTTNVAAEACETYRFSARGKLLDTTTSSCANR